MFRKEFFTYLLFILLVCIIATFSFLKYVGSQKKQKINEQQPYENLAKYNSADFLKAQYASKVKDYDEAFLSLNNIVNKDVEGFLYNALEYAILSGNYLSAFEISSKIDEKELFPLVVLGIGEIKKYKEKPQSNKEIGESGDIKLLLRDRGAVNNPYMQQILENFSEIRTNHSSQTIVSLLSAWMKILQNDNVSAIEELNKIEKTNETIVIYHIALLHSLTGNFAEAEKYYKKIDTVDIKQSILNSKVSFFNKIGKEELAAEIIADFKSAYPDVEFWSNDLPMFEYMDNDLILKYALIDIFEYYAELFYIQYFFKETEIFANLILFLDADNTKANLLLANINMRDKKYKKAIGFYKNIKKNSVVYLDTKALIAECLYKMGDLENAKELLNNLYIKHKEEKILLKLSDILLSAKEFQNAFDVLDRIIKNIDVAKKEDWIIFYNRGIASERIGNLEKAYEDFQEALTLSPDEPYVLNYLGYSWLMNNENIVEAERILKIAVSKKPNDAHILDSYGWALYMLERYEEALPYLEKALVLEPENDEINDHVGDLYWKLGRYEEARYQWRRALNIVSNQEVKKKIIEKISVGL